VPKVRRLLVTSVLPALLLASSGAGCAAPVVAEPLTGKYGGNEPEAQLEFWHSLAQRPIASNDEAFHALLLYLDGKDPAGDYGGRVAELKRRRALPSGFNRPAGEAVERGTLAVALVRTLKIDGGWALTLLGPTPRYATRELQYLGLFPPSTPRQTFSGMDVVGVIGRVEDYQRGDAAEAPAAVLPGEIPRAQ
jgi:hypothetical protein